MAYRRKDNVIARRIMDESLLVPVRGKLADLQRLYVLEGVGEFIWNRVDGRRSVADIGRAVAAEFDVGLEEAERDAREFVTELGQLGLITEGT